MAGLKSLAKDTAIYGLSSIVGRFLNYLLVPIYAAAMSAASGGYGVVTEVYAWTALLMVILPYGMETTFFRFVNKETENSERVYSTVLFMVGSTSLVFAALCMLFLHPVAGMMGYGDHPWYIGMMALVIAMDAFQCIPFAYLRFKNLSIGYTLPINKRFFEKVRVYVSGENLYYWSPLKKHNKTIDPELAISSSTYSSNTGSGYAYPRVYTVGVDITF